MIEERRLANENKYEDPIFSNIEETHDNYNINLESTIKNLTQNCRLVVASHNEQSVLLARDLIEKHNINR